MSGHSKWSNIKRQKMANDKAKGTVFSKITRIITLAVIEGRGITDPDNNVKLRLAIEKAHASNMPKENIKRAIEKGFGPDKNLLKEIIYEGFAPYGVALIIHGTTDNPNRTLSEVRNILEKHQGKLGSKGSVSYLFQKCGLIIFDKALFNQEQILMIGDKLGAFDISEDDQNYSIFFPYEQLGHIKQILNDIKYITAEIDFKPQTTIAIDDDAKLKKISEIVNSLEELEDVQKVFTNIS